MCVKGSSLACHGQLLWALRFNTAQLHMCGFKQAMVNQGDAQDTDLMLTTDVKELQGKNMYHPCLSATTASAQEAFLKQI